MESRTDKGFATPGVPARRTKTSTDTDVSSGTAESSSSSQVLLTPHATRCDASGQSSEGPKVRTLYTAQPEAMDWWLQRALQAGRREPDLQGYMFPALTMVVNGMAAGSNKSRVEVMSQMSLRRQTVLGGQAFDDTVFQGELKAMYAERASSLGAGIPAEGGKWEISRPDLSLIVASAATDEIATESGRSQATNTESMAKKQADKVAMEASMAAASPSASALADGASSGDKRRQTEETVPDRIKKARTTKAASTAGGHEAASPSPAPPTSTSAPAPAAPRRITEVCAIRCIVELKSNQQPFACWSQGICYGLQAYAMSGCRRVFVMHKTYFSRIFLEDDKHVFIETRLSPLHGRQVGIRGLIDVLRIHKSQYSSLFTHNLQDTTSSIPSDVPVVSQQAKALLYRFLLDSLECIAHLGVDRETLTRDALLRADDVPNDLRETLVADLTRETTGQGTTAQGLSAEVDRAPDEIRLGSYAYFGKGARPELKKAFSKRHPNLADNSETPTQPDEPIARSRDKPDDDDDDKGKDAKRDSPVAGPDALVSRSSAAESSRSNGEAQPSGGQHADEQDRDHRTHGGGAGESAGPEHCLPFRPDEQRCARGSSPKVGEPSILSHDASTAFNPAVDESNSSDSADSYDSGNSEAAREIAAILTQFRLVDALGVQLHFCTPEFMSLLTTRRRQGLFGVGSDALDVVRARVADVTRGAGLRMGSLDSDADTHKPKRFLSPFLAVDERSVAVPP